MFKTLNDLEKSMCSSLNFINQFGTIPDQIPRGSDESLALHQCLSNGYIENLDEWEDANGHYSFNPIGHVHLTQSGMRFLRDMSKSYRIKNAVFDVLKGTLGYILGVATPITVELIIWIARNSTEIREFLLRILQR